VGVSDRLVLLSAALLAARCLARAGAPLFNLSDAVAVTFCP